MKKNILKAIAFVSLVGLLPACSSDDDSEMLDRRFSNGIPILRNSAEGTTVMNSSGSKTKSGTFLNSSITVSANWSIYTRDPEATVQPQGYVRISVSGGKYSFSESNAGGSSSQAPIWDGNYPWSTGKAFNVSGSGVDTTMYVTLEVLGNNNANLSW